MLANYKVKILTIEVNIGEYFSLQSEMGTFYLRIGMIFVVVEKSNFSSGWKWFGIRIKKIKFHD